MHIDILTIFPDMFIGPLSESIIKRAMDKKLATITIHDLRQWATDRHHTTDDRPYGGGPGMVMLIEPIDHAIHELKSKIKNLKPKVILTSAKGKLFTQAKARELSKLDHLVFIAGHYEGVDERVADHLVDEELSIGEFVLTGGELPVMVMVDGVIRLLPGVLGDSASLEDESYNQTGYLESPHYTRPENYKGWRVPEVLLNGNHAAIRNWRQKKSRYQ
jgi:tRNA (guanine37-N1)-methyltransferase